MRSLPESEGIWRVVHAIGDLAETSSIEQKEC